MAWEDRTDNSDYKTESWNMADAFMRKISDVLDGIIEIWKEPYQDGMPRYKELLRLERTLKMLVSVYLTEDELEEAQENYIKYFIEMPIVDTGSTTIIPLITEEKLYDFPEWILKRLKAKGALVPAQFDPDLAL
ncbi:MAG: hypothetical protein NTY03_04310 [Candidatus Bathyarchaeota archaeon]|nr:hypothetical protein [Candidatus Bathyarchaeota archaeon]